MQSRILTVGRLIPRKGHPYLIKAVKILVSEGLDVKLVIIGKGPDKEQLYSLAKGIDFEIHSDVLEEDVNEEYKKADIFVLPSITDSKGEKEGLGMVLFEAISFNTPVIAFANGGISEVIINNETGILLPEKDVNGLVNAIKKLITDEPYKNELINRAYRIIKDKFSTETLVSQQIEVYENILQTEH
jgi:glycosyltransferase involved in cell wall biosynthesis